MNTKIDVLHPAKPPLEETKLLCPLPDTANERVADWRDPFRTDYVKVGLVLLGTSALVFWLFDSVIDIRSEDGFTLFGVHYIAALFYAIMVLARGGFGYLFRHKREQQAAMWLVMPLWLISAFALNRSLNVFEQSAPWLCGVLVGGGVLMVAHIWADWLPRWGQQLLYAGLAAVWLLFAYQAIYVGALYGISVPAMLALGISAHTFVPLTLAFVIGRQLWAGARERTYLRPAVLVGLGLPTALLVLFLFNWHRITDRLDRVRVEASLRATSDLPDWVLMAQQLVASPITDRILKVNSVYGTSPWSRSFGELRALDDVRLHDPLVVIAQNLFPAPTLSDAEQMKLLRAVSQTHYGTESKFWEGRNLSTRTLTTQVRLWPQYRMSYTEKTMVVRSAAQWGNREALYTFHLPEGSAVSALSLWINGREEPARLTTQAKADSAYRQIVGVESLPKARDPSVLTWQEGNRITVRVFPVLPGQERQFKVGITSPLRYVGGRLVYQNPWFEGPPAYDADETVKLTFAQKPTNLQLPWPFEQLTNNQLTHRAPYRPDWSLTMAAPPLATSKPFVLAGNAYAVQHLKPALTPFSPTDLYLDINAAWTKTELETVVEAAQKRGIAHTWAFNDGMIEVTPQNRDEVFEALAQHSFSLFPMDRIANPATALLVTKGTVTGPTLSDLAQSQFADKLNRHASQLSAPIRTLCLSDAPSPYLKTLAELRVLHLVSGTLAEASGYVANRRFPAQTESTNRVELPTAGIVIDSKPLASTVGAANAPTVPDHVVRLFVYNRLMSTVGRHYFDSSFRNDASLAGLAQFGHVVSPASSLVVLETQHDYDRFGIKTDKNGLDNATLKEEGGVPEPHEWALIIMAAAVVLWQYRKRTCTLS